MTFTESELKVLKRIVGDWIGDGFTTPPYGADYYHVFEELGLNPDDFNYDIRRPKEPT